MKTVSSNYACAFFEAALRLGAKKADLLSALDVDERVFSDPTFRFPCENVLSMLGMAQLEDDETTLGLLAGESFRPSSFGDIGHAAICCSTISEAMTLNAKYQALNQQFGVTSMHPTGDETHLKWDADGYDPEIVRPITEAAIAGWFRMGRWLLWEFDAKPNFVSFRHGKTSDHCENYFECEVRYGQDADFIASEAFFADIKIPQSNPQMLTILKDRLDRSLSFMESKEEISGRVYQCVQQMLGERGATIDGVAEMLGMHKNEVSNRLRDENTNFRSVLKSVRIENFRYHEMEGSKTLTEIALALGYSDHSAFTRAYRSWFGHAPSQNGTWVAAKS